MSLRTRLIALLLVLAASGMVVLAGVTYASQRSFENDRVDEQTRVAEPALNRALDEKLGIERFPGGRGGPKGRGPGDANLPPGTYGQRRDASGRVLATVILTYGGEAEPAPKLPADLEPGELSTVDAVSGGGRYRIRADATPGGVTVVAVPLSGVDAALDRLLLVEALVIGGVLLLIALAGTSLVRLELRPLERIGATADAIAAGDLDRRVEVGNERNEVGRLGVALNGMLGRLEHAFAERAASEQRLRQFLSDASHELRTPLASIRGYAELFRMGAAREPDQVERSMQRIEDEAARMGVLVEDLLTLARLDEVRQAEEQLVDVAELVEDAGADARAMDPAREVEVRVDGEALVLGDPNGLRQVLANLVRNALVHTPAGTPLELSTRVQGDRVTIEVRDHGPGLPTERPEELFERFWRSEGAHGRQRGKAGAGLGLAIVAGIVHAHGGQIDAGDAPGGGALFAVTFPTA